MCYVLPKREELRRAIQWISCNIQENPGKPVQPYVRDAIFRFDLSPIDAEFLIEFFHKRKEEK